MHDDWTFREVKQRLCTGPCDPVTSTSLFLRALDTPATDGQGPSATVRGYSSRRSPLASAASLHCEKRSLLRGHWVHRWAPHKSAGKVRAQCSTTVALRKGRGTWHTTLQQATVWRTLVLQV